MSGFPFSFEPWIKLRSATTAWGGVLASLTAKKGPRKVKKVKKKKKKKEFNKNNNNFEESEESKHSWGYLRVDLSHRKQLASVV
jgi:hypothetical protein